MRTKHNWSNLFLTQISQGKQHTHTLPLYSEGKVCSAQTGMLCSPSVSSTHPFTPLHSPPSCTHSGQRAAECRCVTTSLSILFLMPLSLSSLSDHVKRRDLCRSTQISSGDGEQVSLFFPRMCVSVCVRAPCRPFQCDYLFFCVEVAHFFFFCVCVAVFLCPLSAASFLLFKDR